MASIEEQTEELMEDDLLHEVEKIDKAAKKVGCSNSIKLFLRKPKATQESQIEVAENRLKAHIQRMHDSNTTMENAKDNLESIEATNVELNERKADELKRYKDAKTAKATEKKIINRLHKVIEVLKLAFHSRTNKYATMIYPDIRVDVGVSNRDDVLSLTDPECFSKLRKLKIHGIEKHEEHDGSLPKIRLRHEGSVFDRQMLIGKLLKINMELAPAEQDVEEAVDDLLLADDEIEPPQKKAKTGP